MRTNRSFFTLVVLSLAGLLIGCGESVESAGPKMREALRFKDTQQAEKLAREVKGLGNYRPAPDQLSILAEVCSDGNLAMADLLLNNGADPKATDSVGRDALIMSSNSAIISRLLQAGADPNHISPGSDMTVLGASVRRADPESVKVLLAGGADSSKTGKDGKTPLQIAQETKELFEGPDQNKGDADDLLSKAKSSLKVSTGEKALPRINQIIAMLEVAGQKK